MAHLENLAQMCQALPARDLAAFDAVRLSDRVETKALLSADLVCDWLRSSAADLVVLDHQGCRSQRYRNLYFDDRRLRFYRDHHNRRGRRSKVRFRSYGSDDTTFFEVKHKANTGRTTKYRLASEPPQARLSVDQQSMVAEHTQVTAELKPVLAIGYERILLANADMTERITIDIDLRCRSHHRRVAFSPTVIMELKQPALDRMSPAYRNLRSLGVRSGSFSKYCVGVASCIPGVPVNRFKPMLRRAVRTADAAAATTPAASEVGS